MAVGMLKPDELAEILLGFFESVRRSEKQDFSEARFGVFLRGGGRISFHFHGLRPNGLRQRERGLVFGREILTLALRFPDAFTESFVPAESGPLIDCLPADHAESDEHEARREMRFSKDKAQNEGNKCDEPRFDPKAKHFLGHSGKSQQPGEALRVHFAGIRIVLGAFAPLAKIGDQVVNPIQDDGTRDVDADGAVFTPEWRVVPYHDDGKHERPREREEDTPRLEESVTE